MQPESVRVNVIAVVTAIVALTAFRFVVITWFPSLSDDLNVTKPAHTALTKLERLTETSCGSKRLELNVTVFVALVNGRTNCSVGLALPRPEAGVRRAMPR